MNKGICTKIKSSNSIWTHPVLLTNFVFTDFTIPLRAHLASLAICSKLVISYGDISVPFLLSVLGKKKRFEVENLADGFSHIRTT